MAAAGLLEWVAATSKGLTPWPAGWCMGPGWPLGAGVFVPPVGMGVEKSEGSSEVKMVPDGERMNFCVMVLSKDCVNPGSQRLVEILKYGKKANTNP